MNLSLQILFDRPMTQFSYLPSPGGFALRTKDPLTDIENVYAFDFCESQGDVDPNEPCIVGWNLYYPDKQSFPDMDELLQHLMDVTAIEDCFIDMEAFEENNRPRPLQIVSFGFENCTIDDVGLPCFQAKSSEQITVFYHSDERHSYFLDEKICHAYIYPAMRQIQTIRVSFTFEIDIDVADLDAQTVDKIAFAKEAALNELEEQMDAHDVTDDLCKIQGTISDKE